MLQPLKNRILIERDPVKEFTESGLTIPTIAQDREVYGTVLAIGSEVIDVKVNDRVLFGKHDGAIIDSKYVGHKGDFIIITEDAVRAIIINA